MADDKINIELTEENYMIKDKNGEMVPNYDLTMVNFNDGDVVKGRVVKIEKDEVLVDVGFKSEGVIPVSELSIRNTVKENGRRFGDTIIAKRPITSNY